MTGADSPVIADSSTEAAPSMTSPSPGISSPASMRTTSPARSSVAPTVRRCPSTRLRAWVSVLVRRRNSACAFPRPSATASAKFAKSTINHSQIVMAKSKPAFFPPAKTRSRKKNSVVTTAPIRTMNMTGFLACRRGSSLRNESRTARVKIARSNKERAFGRRSRRRAGIMGLVRLSFEHLQVLDDRAQRVSWEERERTDDEDDAEQEHHERRRGRAERTDRRRDALLPRQRAGQRDGRNDEQETAANHAYAGQQVVVRVAAHAGEGAAVVLRRRGEHVENLGEAVRRVVAQRRQAARDHHRDRRRYEREDRQHQRPQDRELDLPALDLLSEVLGRATHHQARDEDGQHDEDDHAVEAGADAPEDHLAELHVDQGNQSAERRPRVVHRVHRARRRVESGRPP